MDPITKSFILKIVGGIIGRGIADKLKEIGKDKRTSYEKELFQIINEVITEFKSNFDYNDVAGKYSFIKSAKLIELLLEYSFGKELNRNELIQVLKNEPNIIPPDDKQLEFVIGLFHKKVKESETLKELNIEDNFKKEIFQISKVIKEVEEKTEKIEMTLEKLVCQTQSSLSQVFHSELSDIEKCLESFQVVTALELLKGLKKRIELNGVIDKILNARLTYFEAVCVREIPTFPLVQSSKLFIKAHNLSPDNLSFKKTACVEYINVNQQEKAEILADELLRFDEFDITGWVIKTIVSDNIRSFVEKVPDIIKDSAGYNNSVAYYLIFKKMVTHPFQIEDYGVKIKVNEEQFRELTLFTKAEWTLNITLLYNLELTKREQQYISGKDFGIEKTPELKLLISFLEKFVGAIENSEMKESIVLSKFMLEYYRYRITNDSNCVIELDKICNGLELDSLTATQYCQVLNHCERYKDSLEVLNKFTNPKDQYYTQIQIFKCVIYTIIKDIDNAILVFESFIESIEKVNYKQYKNLVMIISNCFVNKVDENIVDRLIDKTIKSDFLSETHKELAEIQLRLKFSPFDDKYKEKCIEELKQISQSVPEREKIFLMDCFLMVGESGLAVKTGSYIINDPVISEELGILIIALYENLRNRNEDKSSNHSTLMELLAFWRNNARQISIRFLEIEHSLFVSLNDWKNACKIVSQMYKYDPLREPYIAFYLQALFKIDDTESILEVSESIPAKFTNESYGLTIANILYAKKINTEKAFDIVYNLALNKSNSSARTFYFGQGSMMREDKFIKYDIIEADTYVEYVIEGASYEDHIDNNHEWLGKSVGEEILKEQPLIGIVKKIIINRCYNKYLKLFYEILKEANNPNNKMGIQSVEFDTSSSVAFEEQLKNMLGIQGEREEEFRKEQIAKFNNYQIGFTTITRSLFKEDFISSYNTLVITSKMNIVPKMKFAFNYSKGTKFILDFSSMMLFFKLEKQFGISFNHKFTISTILLQYIEDLIVEEENTPKSTMSVQVTTKSVVPSLRPENYKEQRIEYLKSIKDWVVSNCETEIVKEKLDVILKLEGEPKGKFFQLLVDNLMLSQRTGYCLLSGDPDYFLMFPNTAMQIQSPELYLNEEVDDLDKKELYKFLLSKNYIGLTIPSDNIYQEFIDYLSMKQNSFKTVLDNLPQWLNPHKSKIDDLTTFISNLYLLSAIKNEDKNKHFHIVLSSVFQGSNDSFRKLLYLSIRKKMKLYGDKLDQALTTYILAEKQLVGYSVNT